MKRLFGHDNQFPAETFKKPITYHDEIVGWVIVSAADKISNEEILALISNSYEPVGSLPA